MRNSFLRYSVLNELRKLLELNRFKRKWRKKNTHNKTVPENVFDIDLVEVGKGSYGKLYVVAYGHQSNIKIGKYCSIAEEVRFVINADHRIDTISSFPFKVMITEKENEEAVSAGDIIIDDDVWIGYRATILDGIHIGQGAVIAAGAVVTKDVDPYSIVGGVPAKPIGRRLSMIAIDDLMDDLDYSNLSEESIETNIETLYLAVNEENYSTIRELFTVRNPCNT